MCEKLCCNRRSGPLASVHVDYVRRPAARSIELVGENGVLRWDYDQHRLWHYTPESGQWRLEEGERTFERNAMFVAELQHVAECIAGRVREPLVDGAQGAAILAIALAALRSSATGCTVDLAQEGAPVTTWLSRLGT